MLQTTLHLTRSSHLWDTSTPSTLSTSTPLRKKKHFNCLCGDTQKRDFRRLKIKIIIVNVP
jgi:hypothetical protein